MTIGLKSRYFLRRFYYQFKKPSNMDFPETISIELSIICNARCKFCPHSQIKQEDSQRAINMSDVLFEKIISECANKKELRTIKPNLYGDPSVTPKIFERLKYIRKMLPNVNIKIVTNGAELIKEKTDRLIKERLCDEITFSIDASRKETFEKFKGISWEKTMNNLEYFIKKNKECGEKIRVILSYIHTPENQGQFREFKKRWKKKVFKFHIGSEVGLNRRSSFIEKNTNLACSEPFKRLNILSDGRITICCADAFGEVVVGDANKQKISDIWNGNAFRIIRKLHLKGRKKRIPICSKCNEWL